MKYVVRAALFVSVLFTFACGNSNNQAQPQCTQDMQCNASNVCMGCQNGQCVKIADCCSSDAECGGGRCWNVPGKAYGRCGAK